MQLSHAYTNDAYLHYLYIYYECVLHVVVCTWLYVLTFKYATRRTRSERLRVNEVSFRAVTWSQGSWTIICGRRVHSHDPESWCDQPEDQKKLLGLEDKSYLLYLLRLILFIVYTYIFICKGMEPIQRYPIHRGWQPHQKYEKIKKMKKHENK